MTSEVIQSKMSVAKPEPLGNTDTSTTVTVISSSQPLSLSVTVRVYVPSPSTIGLSVSPPDTIFPPLVVQSYSILVPCEEPLPSS